MTSETLNLVPETHDHSPAARRSVLGDLVFLGFHVSWRRQVGDLVTNTLLAEEWENGFDHWSIESRNVHLMHSALGYSVYLSDGAARFVLQIPGNILPIARQHAVDLLRALREGNRRSISLQCEAQYLQAVSDIDYESLNIQMANRMLDVSFSSTLGVELLEMQYLVDGLFEGQWVQIKAGPISAEQVPLFVESNRLEQIPEKARFYSVSSKAPLSEGNFDFDSFLSRVFRLGDAVAREIRK